eukprot:366449-Chlamydomonas_euryale.AAC.15
MEGVTRSRLVAAEKQAARQAQLAAALLLPGLLQDNEPMQEPQERDPEYDAKVREARRLVQCNPALPHNTAAGCMAAACHVAAACMRRRRRCRPA